MSTTITIMLIYLAGLLAITLVSLKVRKPDSEDYFLAGRNQNWLVTSLTLMATFFSAFALMGAPGMSYSHGLVFVLFSLNVPIAGMCIWVIGKRIHEAGKEHGFMTPSDLICHHYPSKLLSLCVCLIALLYVLPYIILQIKAGGYLFSVITDGAISMKSGAVLLAFITMIYIHIGGMRSVAWTDVIQGFLLMIGMLWGGYATYRAVSVDGAFFTRIAELGDAYLTMPGAKGFFTAPMILTMVVGGAIGSMLSPGQWLRYNAARSKRELRRSALIFSVLLTLCYLFGTLFIGLGGRILFPDLAQADQVFLLVIKNHLPHWAASLFIVTIIAAAMSTADSNLHALGAIFSKDVYQKILFPDANKKRSLFVGHLVIFVTTLIALAIVIFIEDLGTLVKIGIVSMSYCLQLLPVLTDILWKRIGSAHAAIAGILAGLLTVTLLFFYFKTNPLNVHAGMWGLFINTTVYLSMSLFSKARS